MKTTLMFAAVVLAVAMAGPASAATITVSGSVGGAPTGVVFENFDLLSLGSGGGTTATGIFVSFTPDGKAVRGATAEYAAPYLSGGNGTGFGTQVVGEDATTYLSTGVGTVNLTMPGTGNYFGLLWGSVDTYNTLSFYQGTTLIGSVTGSDVLGSPSGNQGINGTVYVNISVPGGFDHVVASSTAYAFEFDNVAFKPTDPVPEPASMLLLGTGLLGLGRAWRKRRG